MWNNTHSTGIGAEPAFEFAWAGEWDRIENEVRTLPAGEDRWYAKTTAASPLQAGYRRSFGVPKGTLLHYRKAAPDGTSTHVREYDDSYAVHWDRRDPQIDPIGHLVQDAPGALFGIGMVGLLFAAAIAGASE